MLWVVFWIAVALVGGAGAITAAQGLRFERRVEREARALLAGAAGGAPALVPLDALPAPVRRYLEVSGAAGRAPIRTARLRHGGSFVTAPGKAPMAIRGVQWFRTDPPGFVWWGRIRAAPGLWIDGRDRSVGGEGNMLIRAASTITLADVRGPELDQGALLRLLGEAFWFPTLLRDARYVTWTSLDGARARATLRVDGREVAGTFHFGADGLPERFSADRHRDVDGRAVLTPWSGDCSDFREVDGVKVPFRVGATWSLESGPLRYAAWQVERVELDVREP